MTIGRRLYVFVLALIAATALAVFAACSNDDPVGQRVLDHIELNTANAKTEFSVGDAFTYQGLEVKAHYADESSAVVTGYTVTANNLDDGKLTAKSDEATVSYTEDGVTKTAAYTITVKTGNGPTDEGDPDDDSQEPENTVKSIEIIKEPTTTVYYVGDTFTTEGLELKVTYDDDTTDTVTTGFTAHATTLLAGTISVTVSYGGKTDTFTITIHNKLTGLLIGGTARYAVGSDFEGVTVSALYNGKTAGGTALEEGDYEMDIDPALTDGKFAETGKYTVTVVYSEEKIEKLTVSETFTVTVTDPDDPNLIGWGEEGHSVGAWKYWVDDNENNAIITDAEVRFIDGAEGVNINAVFSSSGESYYGFQLFYNDTENYNIGSRYTLTLTVTSQSDCTVVINGQSYTLTAGSPEAVEVTFGYSYNGIYTGMSLFDMQVEVETGKSYDLTFTGIKWEKVEDTSGGGTGGGDIGGEDYIVQLTKVELYNGMYVKLYMSSADFALLSGAAKVVVNGTYTGGWAGGFLVDGNVCIHVMLLASGTASGDYTLTWYDGDGNLIATCSFTA